MNLKNKKELASRVLGVGKGRIFFDSANLKEIKEAITKQDILELHKEKIILIKDKHGRLNGKKVKKRKRGPGKRKKNLKKRKEKYMILTRKLRGYILELKKQEKISKERYRELRKKIKASEFKSKSNLKESLKNENR